MKSYLIGAASVLSLLAGTSASAQDTEGWYLRGNAGYGIHQDFDVTGLIDSSIHGNGLQSEGDLALSLGAGYDFGDWRLELDGDHLDTDFGSISQTPSSSASLLTESVMLNALYDFDGFGKWEPYLGAGVGYVSSKANLLAQDFAGVDNELVRNTVCTADRVAGQGGICGVSDSDQGLGWQLLAGLGYKVSDNLTWDTHYTFLQAPSADLSGQFANASTGDFSFADVALGGLGAHSLVSGLRYTFGKSTPAPVVAAPVAPVPTFTCWDNNVVFNSSQCAVKPEPVVEYVPEPEVVEYVEPVVVEPTTYACWDNSIVYDLATCPIQPVQEVIVQGPNLNLCSESSVGIFNVPANATPKQMSRLGTLPEFGDSHGLSSDQFFEKLSARYNSNAGDKAYLNYLFKSMGYSNGWADAQAYMFSEEVLPVGTRGLLGLGEQHHYAYSILPTNERDRQAFRIQSANGAVVHFMKTCGNYMYACE